MAIQDRPVNISPTINVSPTINISPTINKTIQESGASDELKAKLEELSKAVEAMTKEMPPDKAEETADNLQKFVSEAASGKPKKKWYSVSAEGLIEAAKAVGSLGKEVIVITRDVLKLLSEILNETG